jgi:hypothetical protein
MDGTLMCHKQRDTVAARRFFIRALRHGPAPAEKTGRYLRVLDELVPAAAHVTEQYRNNPIEADHARLKARLRPMHGLKRPGRPPGSPPAKRSFRTSAAAITNSPPTPGRRADWRAAFSELALTM